MGFLIGLSICTKLCEVYASSSFFSSTGASFGSDATLEDRLHRDCQNARGWLGNLLSESAERPAVEPLGQPARNRKYSRIRSAARLGADVAETHWT